MCHRKMAYRRQQDSPSSEGAEDDLWNSDQEWSDNTSEPDEAAKEYGAIPNPEFIQAWEEYLDVEGLYEEFLVFSEARSRFLGLIQGPVAAEWMQQSATWLMLCKKESQEKSKKTAFSHEKSRKSPFFCDFSLTFHD